MKYLKYFEKLEHGRKEVWEIDDQFFDLMNDDNYVFEMLKRIGMDAKNIKVFKDFNISGIKQQIEEAKEDKTKLYLYFKKVYDIEYVQGYIYYPIIRTRPWENLPDDCDFKGHIKIEEYELQANKFNI